MDQPMEGITVVEVRDKIDHMTYLPGMEQIDPTVRQQVVAAREGYDETRYTAKDVRAALDAELRTPEHFAALLSPAAAKRESIEVCMMLTVGEAEDWGWAGGCSPLLLFCSGHAVVEVSQGGALVLMANYPVAKA